MTNTPTSADAPLILIIDDEETQRLLTRLTLEEEGFRVEEAPNGEEGLARISARQPDLVLLDVLMPGIDGFEVCRRIRTHAATGHMPIIIVTGQEDTEDVRNGFAAGATDFLTKPVKWNLLPNRIRYVLRTSRMETELRFARDAAESASAAKTALLSTMGHELRTPLNAIIGFSELMQQGVFGPLGSDKYTEFADGIHASGIRLLDAINAILTIVQSESSQLELYEQPFSASSLVDVVVKQVAAEAASLDVRVLDEVTDDGVCILGDEQRLEQSMHNLVSNAVRFSDAGGTVSVKMTATADQGVVFTIEDNGIGIAAKDLPRIMEPFEQADSRLAREYEGLGLGLSVARAFARLHGDDLTINSRIGTGTTVRLSLPPERIFLTTDRAENARSA